MSMQHKWTYKWHINFWVFFHWIWKKQAWTFPTLNVINLDVLVIMYKDNFSLQYFKVLKILLLACLGPDCFRYSLNNKGPCINGGNLTCKGDEVAPAITCKCPPNYQGMFCEEKMENVIEIKFSVYMFLTRIFFCRWTMLTLIVQHKCNHNDNLHKNIWPDPTMTKLVCNFRWRDSVIES